MPQERDTSYQISEIIILAADIFLIRFWIGNQILSGYNLQLTAFLVVVYFLVRSFSRRGKNDSQYQNVFLDVVILTAVLLLVISTTGSLSSPLFFIIYFYLFAFALLFEPITTIVTTCCLAAFFIKDLNSISSALQSFSLLLFSPLAIFFSRQYLKLLESQEKIKILAKKSKQLTAISSQQSADIASEETNSLLWLSLEFKDSLLKIIHYSAELMSDIGHLNFVQKDHLEKIHQTAKDVLKSGEKLKEKIDKETD